MSVPCQLAYLLVIVAEQLAQLRDRLGGHVGGRQFRDLADRRDQRGELVGVEGCPQVQDVRPVPPGPPRPMARLMPVRGGGDAPDAEAGVA
jgi:hypothetical protein